MNKHTQPPSPLERHRPRGDAPVCFPAPRPRLLLRPAAFWKLQYLCHAATTEVGGFGLSAEGDLLTLDDILVVRQQTTSVTVEFDDDAVADLVDRMVDAGVAPNRCSRVWVHTHPGDSPMPSSTDEQTFARSFGGCEWSVMLILARGGAFYARLQQVGTLRTAVEIPVEIDYAGLPVWLDTEGARLADRVATWRLELAQLVTPLLHAGFTEEIGVSRGLRFDAWESARTLDEREWLAFHDLEAGWFNDDGPVDSSDVARNAAAGEVSDVFTHP